MKKSFKLYYDSLDVLKELSDEQSGQLFKAIISYEKDGEEILEGLMKAVFTPFKNNIDRANIAYKAVCERNKANGLKGGRPKPTGTHSVKVGNNLTQDNPKEADKDKDKDKDKDTIAPINIISFYKDNISNLQAKVKESSSFRQIVENKEDMKRIYIGLSNYSKEETEPKFVKSLDKFIQDKVYLDYQETKKVESKLEGWK